MNKQVCKICGCTDEQACQGGCFWVKPNLCSQCVDKKKSKKQLKDMNFSYATIKIRQIREVFKINNDTHKYKDKMFCVKIKQGNIETSFCKTTLKELFKNIKEELYVK